MARRVLAVATTAVLILAACGSSAAPPASQSVAAPQTPSTAPPTTEASPRPAMTLAGAPMEPCLIGGSPAVCGELTVPEDRTASGGRMIGIRVAVLPATGPVARPDPVFWLTGGPGGAATEEYGWIAERYAALNAERDFVLVDQRGTGGSNRLVAPPPPDLTGLSPAATDVAIRAWVTDALAGMPGDPRYYTTSVAMDDLDDVRAALGYDRINLVGGSYGATAAQYYLRQHEDRVRTMVLDGGTLIGVNVFEAMAANSQRSLDLLFARCAEDSSCHAAFPALQSDLRVAQASLARGPVTTGVVVPWTGRPVVVDAATFAGSIHQALLDDAHAALVPAFVHAAARGQWDRVASAIVAGMSGAPGGEQLVMSAIIRCSEAWARFDPATTARLGADSYLRAAQVAAAKDQARSCRYIPAGVIPADDASPARADVPSLIVVGEADPQDPPANVASAATALPNSTTVIVPGAGHTVAHLGCLPSIVSEFVSAGTADHLDATCVATTVLLAPFDTSR